MNYSLQIKQYIESKKGAWAETTLRSESARLHGALAALNMSPEQAHGSLASRLKPYALKTTMVRLADFRAFLGDHTWKAWIKTHANLYKNAYTRRVDGPTYEMAMERITTLEDLRLKNALTEICNSGMRASELRTRVGNNVVGKGSKPRTIFGAAKCSDTERLATTYREVYDACKAINCTPHQLRKAYIDKIARSGKVTEVDLLKIAGWSSMETAKSYLQPMRDEKLAATLQGVFDGK